MASDRVDVMGNDIGCDVGSVAGSDAGRDEGVNIMSQQTLEKETALSVIWAGIVNECEGGLYKEEFQDGSADRFCWDSIYSGLKRYDLMLHGISLVFPSDAAISRLRLLLNAALVEFFKCRQL